MSLMSQAKSVLTRPSLQDVTPAARHRDDAAPSGCVRCTRGARLATCASNRGVRRPRSAAPGTDWRGNPRRVGACSDASVADAHAGKPLGRNTAARGTAREAGTPACRPRNADAPSSRLRALSKARSLDRQPMTTIVPQLAKVVTGSIQMSKPGSILMSAEGRGYVDLNGDRRGHQADPILAGQQQECGHGALLHL